MQELIALKTLVLAQYYISIATESNIVVICGFFKNQKYHFCKKRLKIKKKTEVKIL
jgi:hypothetical protein